MEVKILNHQTLVKVRCINFVEYGSHESRLISHSILISDFWNCNNSLYISWGPRPATNLPGRFFLPPYFWSFTFLLFFPLSAFSHHFIYWLKPIEYTAHVIHVAPYAPQALCLLLTCQHWFTANLLLCLSILLLTISSSYTYARWITIFASLIPLPLYLFFE